MPEQPENGLKPPSVLTRSKHEKTINDLQQQVKTLNVRVRQAEKIISNCLWLAHGEDLLPPEHLRLHVGTSTASVNFYAQGAASARKVVEVFGRDPEGPVLDWGCGSGRTLNWLRGVGTWDRFYHGCDIDEEAISWLRSRGIENVSVSGHMPPLPYPDAKFSGVFCFSVLTHIHPDNHEDWYRELARVLRTGGRALITVQGSVVIDSGRVSNQAIIEDYRKVGYTYQHHDGHCKDAALVSRDFTERSFGHYFDLIWYNSPGYNNMDLFLIEKRH